MPKLTVQETLDELVQMSIQELRMRKSMVEFSIDYFNSVIESDPKELEKEVQEALEENPKYPYIRLKEYTEKLKRINSEIKFRENNKGKNYLPPRQVVQAKVGKLSRKKT